MEDDNTNGVHREKKVEERLPVQYEEDVIDLREYWAALRSNMWKITLSSLGVGIMTLLLMFLKPNIYKATAVIAPSEDEKNNQPMIGALASSFGVQLGGPSSVEDLESLFKSNDLTVRVFRKHNVWPVVFPDGYDPKTGKLKVGWIDRLLRKKGDYAEPSDWDAIRAAEDSLSVSMKRKAGTLSISFEGYSPEGTSRITGYYLEEAKTRLQEEALNRAKQNKEFIQAQIAKTIDPLTRDRLFSLYGQEVEREMIARNREQFGFRVIDAPRVPDRKIKPRMGLSAITSATLTFFIASIFFLMRKKPHERFSA